MDGGCRGCRRMAGRRGMVAAADPPALPSAPARQRLLADALRRPRRSQRQPMVPAAVFVGIRYEVLGVSDSIRGGGMIPDTQYLTPNTSHLTPYVELHCHSCFSLREGASTPVELLSRAAELGYDALALTDH